MQHDQVFESLYNSREYYANRARQNRAAALEDLSRVVTGVPVIAHKSHSMAQRRRQQRDANADQHLAHSAYTDRYRVEAASAVTAADLTNDDFRNSSYNSYNINAEARRHLEEEDSNYGRDDEFFNNYQREFDSLDLYPHHT